MGGLRDSDGGAVHLTLLRLDSPVEDPHCVLSLSREAFSVPDVSFDLSDLVHDFHSSTTSTLSHDPGPYPSFTLSSYKNHSP